MLNLYYSIITDQKQNVTNYSSSLLSRTSLSPIRKALPVTGTASANVSQRSIANLVGTSVKMYKATSYFHSSSLDHFFDALKGAYTNYLVFFLKYFYLIEFGMLNVSLNIKYINVKFLEFTFFAFYSFIYFI